MTADDIIKKLGLIPLKPEGGFFIETARSTETIETEKGRRNFYSSIYFLLTSNTYSAIHRLKSDEIWHHYRGDAVEMLLLFTDGTHKITTLGNEIEKGQHPQILVPAGVYQGARIVEGGEYALMGTTVSPGFDPDDFELADAKLLGKLYPDADIENFITV